MRTKYSCWLSVIIESIAAKRFDNFNLFVQDEIFYEQFNCFKTSITMKRSQYSTTRLHCLDDICQPQNEIQIPLQDHPRTTVVKKAKKTITSYITPRKSTMTWSTECHFYTELEISIGPLSQASVKTSWASTNLRFFVAFIMASAFTIQAVYNKSVVTGNITSRYANWCLCQLGTWNSNWQLCVVSNPVSHTICISLGPPSHMHRKSSLAM